MNEIQTKNMIINIDLCQRLDKSYYSDKSKSLVVDKWNIYHKELIDLISSVNPKIADHENTSCLYRLCTVFESITKGHNDLMIERGRANMQTAHNQLKNYK